MAFDPEAYLKKNKPSFDPDAYISGSDVTPEPVQMTSAGQAALEHFGNSATLGYLPHLQALAGKLIPNPGADVDADLKAQGFKVSQPKDSYVTERDKNLKRLEAEGKEHPIASGLGTIAGTLSSAALPLGAASKGASIASQAARGALTGAGVGAIANPGDKEGEVAIPIYDDLDKRLKGAAIGGAIGAAAPVAISGVLKAGEKVSNYLRNKAALKATRALGRPTPTQAERMANTGQDVELGRDLLDSGAIPYLGTPNRIASRVEGLKEKAGQEIGDLVERGGNQKLIDSQKLGIQILDSPELAAMRKTPGMESTVAAIEKQVETLAKNGELTLKEAQALRQGIDKSINFNKAAPEMRGAQEGLYQQRTAIRDAMNDAINGLEAGASKDALKTANRRYGNLSTAEDILEREIGRQQANHAFSLGNKVLTSGSTAAGGPAAGLATAAAKKGAEMFGNALQARVYDAIAKKAGMIPSAASRIDPQVASLVAQRAVNGTPDLEREDSPLLKDPRLLDIIRQNPSLLNAIEDERIKSKVKRAIASGVGP